VLIEPTCCHDVPLGGEVDGMSWLPAASVQAVGFRAVVDVDVGTAVLVVGLLACVWVVWVVPPPLVATRMIARITSAARNVAAVM
jgi:hypothetical protein